MPVAKKLSQTAKQTRIVRANVPTSERAVVVRAATSRVKSKGVAFRK